MQFGIKDIQIHLGLTSLNNKKTELLNICYDLLLEFLFVF